MSTLWSPLHGVKPKLFNYLKQLLKHHLRWRYNCTRI